MFVQLVTKRIVVTVKMSKNALVSRVTKQDIEKPMDLSTLILEPVTSKLQKVKRDVKKLVHNFWLD